MDDFKFIYNYNNFLSLVNEGLIHTYPLKTTTKLITRELNKLGINFFKIEVEESTSTIFLKLKSKFINNFKEIIRSISMCGYFPSTIDMYDKDNNFIESIVCTDYQNLSFDDWLVNLCNKVVGCEYILFIIESKFNEKVELPNKLYHITNIENVNKILKTGLIPKSKSKKAYHTDRIYLGYNILQTKGLSSQFDKGEYALLLVDTNNLDINIYDDPDFTKMGCYTYDNIPPENIKYLMSVKVN